MTLKGGLSYRTRSIYKSAFVRGFGGTLLENPMGSSYT
jgi:hypothetical protein